MLIFAYGTLVLPIIRNRVLGHPVDTRDAVLHGYSKVCGWDYLTLVPSKGTVSGVVFEADEEDIARMDVWEDVPVYRLEEVTVACGDEELIAGVYIMPEPPEFYETVDDSCLAAIPLEKMMADLEAALGACHRERLHRLRDSQHRYGTSVSDRDTRNGDGPFSAYTTALPRSDPCGHTGHRRTSQSLNGCTTIFIYERKHCSIHGQEDERRDAGRGHPRRAQEPA